MLGAHGLSLGMRLKTPDSGDSDEIDAGLALDQLIVTTISRREVPGARPRDGFSSADILLGRLYLRGVGGGQVSAAQGFTLPGRPARKPAGLEPRRHLPDRLWRTQIAGKGCPLDAGLSQKGLGVPNDGWPDG